MVVGGEVGVGVVVIGLVVVGVVVVDVAAVVLLVQPAIVKAVTMMNTSGKNHFLTDLNNLFLLFFKD
jgi:hypothetical protein